MATVEFCYRIEKEAKMARDTTTGEHCECWSKVGLDLAVMPNTEVEYAEMHESLRSILAGQINSDIKNITPISYQEYQEHNDEDDEC